MSQDDKQVYRRSMRLRDFDYSQSGAYFVNICTYRRESLFGDVVGGKVVLSELVETAEEEWLRSAPIRREIGLDPEQCVVVRNHIQGIDWIVVTEATEGRGERWSILQRTEYRRPR